MKGFLSTDEAVEAVTALEMVAESVSLAATDAYRWKWAVVALHSALQGFMVLALRGTDGFHVLSKKAAIAYLEARKAGNPFPGEQLDTYLGLYKKIKSDRMLMWMHSSKFEPRGTQGESVKRLNRLRNHFVHFLPQGYALQIALLPPIFTDCLDVIDFLGWASNNVHWLDSALEARAWTALESARVAVSQAGSTTPSS